MESEVYIGSYHMHNKARQRDAKTSASLQFFRACLRRYMLKVAHQ